MRLFQFLGPFFLVCTVAHLGCAPEATVTLVPESAEIAVGETVQMTATSTSAADTTFSWAVTPSETADVDDGGLVTGLRSGVCTVTATGSSTNAFGSATITVMARDIGEVIVDEGKTWYIEAALAADPLTEVNAFALQMAALEGVEAVSIGASGLSVCVETNSRIYNFTKGPEWGEPPSKGFAGDYPPLKPASTALLMPELMEAGVFAGVGPGFPEVGATVAQQLADSGFTVNLDLDLTVDALTMLHTYELLFLNAHGDYTELDGSTTWGISTLDPSVLADGEGNPYEDTSIPAAYPDDVADGLLQSWCVLYEIVSPNNTYDAWVWAGTAEFIEKYNPSMSNTDLTVLLACKSDAGCERLTALGCSTCAGWDESVTVEHGACATWYFFECMLGIDHTGGYTQYFPFDPPMRPLTLYETEAVLYNVGLGREEDPPYAAFQLRTASQGLDYAIRPAITASAKFMNDLWLQGHFGSSPGGMDLDTTPLTVKTWDQNQVTANWPQVSTGKITVTAANGLTSNPTLLTAYSPGAITFSVSNPTFSGSVAVSGDAYSLAGAFLDVETLGILPITRGLTFGENGSVSWNFQGDVEIYGSRIITNSTGSAPLNNQSLCFNVHEDQIDVHNNIIILSIPQTINGAPFTTSCQLGTITVSTSASYDMETGAIAPGTANWSSFTMYGTQNVTLNIGAISPAPAVDLFDPR